MLRRDATHLQVGTSPGIVLDDRPGLLPLLRLLDGVRDVDRIEELARTRVPELRRPASEVLTELLAIGAVVDGPSYSSAMHRPAHAVGFQMTHETAQLVSAVRTILSAAGIAQTSSTEPDLLVIVSYGEAARSVFERASLLGRTHLPVVIDEDRVRIGPFVEPGRTPCVACHDLHRADWDPAWPALVHQLGHGLPPAGPAALPALALHAAAIEIAAEVLAHAGGSIPRTTGRCLVVGPAHHERVVRPVAFHPRCACDLLSAA